MPTPPPPAARAVDGASLVVASAVGVRRCCVRCGGVLDGRCWIVRYPEAAHEACVDWTARAFPFARELDVMSLLARRLTGRDRDIVAGLLRDLAALARRWPDEATAALGAGRSIVAAARPHLAALDHRDRQRL